ncbi:MAG TPA: diguanylate cyclase [Candidatus Acidoferrales bacterium]|nr:diguanylate cyclase [Candidatus Acidoferrales bacterium]
MNTSDVTRLEPFASSRVVGPFRHVHLSDPDERLTTQLNQHIDRQPAQLETSMSGPRGKQIPNNLTAPGQAALLAAIVNSSRDAIIGMTLKGTIVSWNSGAESMYGYRPEEVIGRSFSLLVPLDRLDEFLGFLEQVLKNDPLACHETVHAGKGGGRIPVLLSASPIRNVNGEIAGLSAISRELIEPSPREQELRHTNEKLMELVRDLQQCNGEMNLVQELSTQLESSFSQDEAHTVMQGSLPRLFPAGSGAVFESNAELKFLEASVSWGEASLKEGIFSAEECLALRRGQTHEFMEPASPIRCPHFARAPQANSICIPLIAAGETLGVLSVTGRPYELSQPNDAQVRLLMTRKRIMEMVAGHIAMALANLKLRERLEAQSIRDPVTGLFNRRYLDETLPREFHRAERDRKCLSIIMCDFDHFKRFNDTNGHAAGDNLLRAFGDLMLRTVRAGDIACRYGGDEFVLILLDTPLEIAQRRAELLLREFRRVTIQHGDRFLDPGTLSMGVCNYPAHGSTGAQLLGAADEALYRAKAAAGDQVALATTAK